MLAWLTENIATIIICAVLIAVVAAIIAATTAIKTAQIIIVAMFSVNHAIILISILPLKRKHK